MNKKDLLDHIESLERIVGGRQNRIRMMKENTGVDDHSRCIAFSMSTPVGQISRDSRQLEKELKDIYQAPASAWSGQTSARLPKLDRLIELLGNVTYHTALVGGLLECIVHGKWVIRSESETADLNAVIEHWTSRIRRSKVFDPATRITKKLNRSIPPIPMRECELFQIVSHIITNAVESLPSGKDGRVTIKTDTRNGEAILEVMDNGYGIREDIQSKIFNPFYSTKGYMEPGESHPGLGLYIADQIIRAYDGRIDLQSEQGIGTVFSVFIPIDEQPDDNIRKEEARTEIRRSEVSKP